MTKATTKIHVGYKFSPANQPIRGHAIAIDFLDGYAADARLMDHSRALHVERIHHADDDAERRGRRRFGFVEWWGNGNPPPTGLNRPVGDAFFADDRTAEFVWQAVIEKIENDAADNARRAAGLNQ